MNARPSEIRPTSAREPALGLLQFDDAGSTLSAGETLLRLLRQLDLPEEFPVPGRGPAEPSARRRGPEEIDRHFTAAEIHDICTAGRLDPIDVLRLLDHLPARCPSCWDALANAAPIDPNRTVVNDPLVRALITMTSKATRDLTPCQRLSLAKACQHPPAFCRLILEESLPMARNNPAAAVELMTWGMNLVLYPAVRLGGCAHDEAVALAFLYMAQALLIEERFDEAADNLEGGHRHLQRASKDRELSATYLEIKARLRWEQRHRKEPYRLLARARDLLKRERLIGRVLEVLIDTGTFRCRENDLKKGREAYQHALDALHEHKNADFPVLELTIHHNLALVYMRQELAKAVKIPYQHLDFTAAESHLQESEALHKSHGTKLMGAHRELLRARIWRVSDAERSAAMYRRAIDGWEALGLPLRQARAMFELVEILNENKRFGETEEQVEQLAQIVRAHEHVQEHFIGLRAELGKLSNSKGREDICMDYVNSKLDVLNRLHVYINKL